MKNYLIRRILQLLPVFLGILFIIFFILDNTPGGPASTIMNPRMTAEQRRELEERLNPDLPVPQKFVNWLSQAVKGEFGYSTKHNKPVTEVIGAAMPQTFTLAFASLIIALLIGIPIGVLGAIKQYSWLDNVFTIFALIGISMPSFFFGLILIQVFSVELGLFPLFGFRDPLLNGSFLEELLDVAHHLVLPVTVLGLGSTASFMRYTRSSMLEVIKQDYIRTARAKGLKEKVVIYRHAFRNAIIPIITLLGFWVPSLFSGAVITESIFGLPGIGRIGVDAVTTRNYPVILAINAMLAMLTLLSTIIVDILYAVADPRIKYE